MTDTKETCNIAELKWELPAALSRHVTVYCNPLRLAERRHLVNTRLGTRPVCEKLKARCIFLVENVHHRQDAVQPVKGKE